MLHRHCHRTYRAVGVAAAIALAVCAWPIGPAAAGVVTIINADGPDEGLNDPTAVAPVGGNTGTTLGAQRLIALQFAADIWGTLLQSPIEIQIRVDWGALDCGPNFGFLGFAGTEDVQRDFPNAPRAGTWYPVAQANKLAQADLFGGVDIGSNFNTEVGTANCLTNFTWYLGIDNNADPATQFDLVTVALHEFAHGLGQLSFLSFDTGEPMLGFMDIYSSFFFDNTAAKGWPDMTNAERAASCVNFGNVVWAGKRVTRDAATSLGNRPELEVHSPAAIAGTYAVGTAAFGPPLTVAGLTAEVALVDDASGTTSDACQTVLNDLTGKIALIDRGGCTFVVKVRNAQSAGAVGAIVVNNNPGPPIDMGGVDPAITIPSVFIMRADGDSIRAQLGAPVSLSLQLDPVFLAGADDSGHVKMYTPNPLEPGSSVHHWDRSAAPDLLLEPIIEPGVPHTGDLTLSLAHDIGWFPEDEPIAVESFQALDSGTAIRLSWRLSDDAVRAGVTVVVERADAEQGPYAALHSTPLAADRFMSFEDLDPPPGVTRWYRLTLRLAGGESVVSPALAVTAARVIRTGLDVPFVSAPGEPLQIRYRIGRAAGQAQLDIYDVAGRRVRSLERGPRAAGEYVRSWDRSDDAGRSVARGVYFVRLYTDGAAATRRFALVR